MTDPALIHQERQGKTEAVAKVAAQRADEVDREARLPQEALAALREARLLGLTGCLDGRQFLISMIADECFRLARSCSSTALIYAMHHIQAACIARHSSDANWKALSRLRDGDVLIGSCTSTQRGTSDALTLGTSTFQLEKSVVAFSYALEADAVLALVHCEDPAHHRGNILAAVFREDCTFSAREKWTALGMRGTSSAGGKFLGSGEVSQILSASNDAIDRQTTMPVAHILLGSVWSGIAAEAVHRSRQSCVARGVATSHALFQGVAKVRRMRSLIKAAIAYFEANKAMDKLREEEFESIVSLLKIDVSTMACEAVLSAMAAGGLGCYKEDGPFSIGRLLRDVVSAPIMINNEIIEGREISKAIEYPASFDIGVM